MKPSHTNVCVCVTLLMLMLPAVLCYSIQNQGTSLAQATNASTPYKANRNYSLGSSFILDRNQIKNIDLRNASDQYKEVGKYSLTKNDTQIVDTSKQQKSEYSNNSNDKFDDTNALDKNVDTQTATQSTNLSTGILADMIVDLCGFGSLCFDSSTPSYDVQSGCCSACSCEESCRTAKNCCPDVHPAGTDTQVTAKPVCMPVYNTLSKVLHSSVKNQPSNALKDSKTSVNDNLVTPEHSQDNPMFADFLVTQSCPPAFNDHDLLKNCMNSQSIYTTDHLPVMDLSTKKIYKNHFCATCNNASSMFPMTVVTNCTQLYLSMSLPEYLQDLNDLTTTQGCLVYIDPMWNKLMLSQLCYMEKEKVISSCNTTGQWDWYDNLIEALCQETRHFVTYTNKQGNKTITYKNVYCFLCNSPRQTTDNQTCSQESWLDKPTRAVFPGFTAYIKVQLHSALSSYLTSQLKEEEEETQLDRGTTQCGHGQLPDVYNKNQCVTFECPIHQSPLYNMCLKKTMPVTGLTIMGRLHIELICAINNRDPKKLKAVLTEIQEAITGHLGVQTSGCNNIPGEMYADSEARNITSFYMMYKIQITEDCSVETAIGYLTKIATENITIEPTNEATKKLPGFSLKMVYTKLSAKNFVKIIDPKISEQASRHGVLLNASFFCPRIVINVSDYNDLVGQGKLKPLSQEILSQEYTLDTGLVEICLMEYLNYWLQDGSGVNLSTKVVYSHLEITISTISTIISMLSICVVMVTYCIFPELRFIPGKLVMILGTNLLLAQACYSFGMDLGIDNAWCKLFGMSIHFFWLSTILSMNSILVLMLRSLYRPLHVNNRVILESRTASELVKYIIHCYFWPTICVMVNILSSTLHITKEFGYGGDLCYIRTIQMRFYTFVIPLAAVMAINFILFILIIFCLRIYMKNISDNVPVKQIFFFFKLITMTGLYWIFGFLFELTSLSLCKFMFIILIAGQGFFLMWSFICNRQVYELYRTAISKYIRKLRMERSQSYSLS